MPPDLVGIIEAIYQLENVTTESWLSEILERLTPWIGDGVGSFGFEYSVPADGHLKLKGFASVGCSEQMHQALPLVLTRLNPAFVSKTYLSADVAAASDVHGWRNTLSAAVGLEFEIVNSWEMNSWGMNGRNAGARGCAVLVNRRGAETVPLPLTDAFVRIATHLGTAQRLRERLERTEAMERAEAILDVHGDICHAIGAAKLPDSRKSLRASAVAMDLARGKQRRLDPYGALRRWRPVSGARWTLLEHFDRDGRRYILAQENEANVSKANALTPREHQVLANAALGRSNKEIAYALGITHSTVRVLLARAGKKLHADTRAKVVDRFQALILAERRD